MIDFRFDPDIESALSGLEEDAGLSDEADFLGRARAGEELECEVIDRLAGLSPSHPEATALRLRAETLLVRWDELDQALFRRLRTTLRTASDAGAAFREMWETHLPQYAFPDVDDNPGYDARDAFLNGLLHPDPIPKALRGLEPEMVPFQKTPARILTEMIARADLGPTDIFCDVGSGLGQIPIAIHLLTGARAFGIEIEPAYVASARACAAALGLSAVAFSEADARSADYSAATVLFLYTPFRGRMLQEVLDRIHGQCRPGTRLFAYGPCVAEIGPGWSALPGSSEEGRLTGFAKA
jgi:hypothetical protein